MSHNAELKKAAEGAVNAGSHWGRRDSFERQLAKLATPEAVLALITENKRLAANVKLNLCDHPAIHQGDVDLLVAFVAGTSQMELAKVHGCTPPNISRKIRRVKDRLGWREGMLVSEIRDRAEQLRALASQGAVVTADLMSERDQLRAEIAGLKTGYEAYERVNAELKAENERIKRNRDMWKGQVERQSEELTALRVEVTEWEGAVKFNEKCWSEERGTMIDKLQESRMRIKELDLLFGRYILAMRAAVIEEEHGLGAEGAMMWIYNSLVGPGELPPENETLAQAYFDREIVAVDNGMQEVLAFHEGRRAALGQGEQS